IVTGEINDWMLEQRRVLFAPYVFRFWEFAANGKEGVPEELKEPVGELRKKRDEMLSAALKNVPPSEESRGGRPIDDPLLDMLPEEKRDQLRELETRYAKLHRELSANKELQ